MKINNAFVLRNIFDKYILMPVRSNRASNEPILLNEVAALIWRFASNGLTEEQILNNISKYYNLYLGSAEMVSVKHFIAHMMNTNLLFEDNEEE